MLDRRKHQRYEVKDTTGIIRNSEEARKVYLEDISDGGARLKFAQNIEIKENSTLKLFFYDRDVQSLLGLNCVVRRVFDENGVPAIGVQFEEGNMTVKNILQVLKEQNNGG